LALRLISGFLVLCEQLGRYITQRMLFRVHTQCRGDAMDLLGISPHNSLSFGQL